MKPAPYAASPEIHNPSRPNDARCRNCGSVVMDFGLRSVPSRPRNDSVEECFCLKRVNVDLDHLGHADGLVRRKIAGRYRLRNRRHRFYRICGILERRKLAAAGLVFWRRRDAVHTHAQCANVAGLRHLNNFARNILRLPFQQALHAPLGDCATRAAGQPDCRFDPSEMASAVPPVEDGHARGATKSPARSPARTSA